MEGAQGGERAAASTEAAPPGHLRGADHRRPRPSLWFEKRRRRRVGVSPRPPRRGGGGGSVRRFVADCVLLEVGRVLPESPSHPLRGISSRAFPRAPVPVWLDLI